MRVIILDPAKLSQLFREKGVDGACPMCKKYAWDLPEYTHAQAFGVTLPWHHVEDGIFPVGIDCLPLVCKNCGFVRLHDARFYRDAFTTAETVDNG